MIRAVVQKLSSSIMGGALIIAVASVLSRLAGLVRDNLLAKYFGASAQLDVYNAAFKVPDLLFNIVVLGALSASFIPVFISVRQKYGNPTAFTMANAILNILLLILVAAVVVSYLFAPMIAGFLLADRPLLQQADATQLMRVMLLSIIFFGISNVISGMLHSFRRFLAYALAPILYNFGIIIGIVLFYPRFGLVGLAYGVVGGAVLHCLVQIPAVWQTGFRYQLVFPWHHPGVKKIFQLMPPRALALGIVQCNAFLMAALALRLPEGSLAVWTWADNLQHFPINVFGVSLALSSFPVFSQALAENDLNTFRQLFSNNFRRILFLIIPVSVGILLLRAQLVRLILGSFGGGQFDWTATILTAQVLGCLSISMFAQATQPLLARSFFAHHDTTTPVYSSIASMVVNILLAWWLVQWLGIYGLALAFSFASLLNMLLLLLILRIKFGDLDDRRIITSTWRIMAATISMGIVIHGMKYFIAPLVDMRTFIGIFIQTIGSLAAGGAIYIAIAYYFNFTEFTVVRKYLRKLLRAL